MNPIYNNEFGEESSPEYIAEASRRLRKLLKMDTPEAIENSKKVEAVLKETWGNIEPLANSSIRSPLYGLTLL